MNYPPAIKPNTTAAGLERFIANTFKAAGKTKALVPISGGLDSSVTLVLAARALKPENTFAIHLPSKTTAEIYSRYARQIMDFTGIPEENRLNIPIKGIIQKTWRVIRKNTLPPVEYKACTETFGGETPVNKGTSNRKNINSEIARANRLRLGNLAARSRMLVIFDQAKKLDALVVGTENRSEQLLGYFTRFGDEASDLEPIRHLFKTQVYALAKYLKIPPEIIAEPPTAGLWPKQTDEAELGFSYLEADPILYLFSEQQLDSNEIIKSLMKSTQKLSEEKTRQLVEAVLRQVKNQSFKTKVPYLVS